MKEIKIFIVEDDSVFVSIFSDLISLIQKDYNNNEIRLITKTFYSITEAAYELTQKPDIVLLDYYITDDNLKPVTSEKLLLDIKRANAKAKIIMISGEDDFVIVDELKEKGADFFISKSPKILQRLIPTIKMIIDNKIKFM